MGIAARAAPGPKRKVARVSEEGPGYSYSEAEKDQTNSVSPHYKIYKLIKLYSG